MNIETIYTERAGLAESPVWDDEAQCFYWIDIPNRRIHRHTMDNEHTVWQLPDGAANDPGAMALSASGDLVVALRSGIALFDVATPAGDISLTPFITAPYDTNNIRFNDGGVDAQGRFWIGTLFAPKTRAGASLFCLEKGQLHAVVGEHAAQHQDWGVTTSNGWATTPDGQKMYHSDTQAHAIYRYTYDSSVAAVDGLSNRSVFYQTLNQQASKDADVPYQGRPDGAAVDSAGNYWSAQFEGGQVIQFAPTGEILQRIALPAKCPTMLCFGGADLKTLIITTTGNRPDEELAQFPANGFILKLRVVVAGLPTRRYRAK